MTQMDEHGGRGGLPAGLSALFGDAHQDPHQDPHQDADQHAYHDPQHDAGHEARQAEGRRRSAAMTTGQQPSLTVPLPEGLLVWPDASFPQRRLPPGPVFWVSDDPVAPQVWCALRVQHPRSGLWPVLLDDSTQPWSAGLVAPEPARDIDDYDPAAFMSEVWSDYVEAVGDDVPELAPYGRRSPGLAPAAAPVGDPGDVADWYARRLAAETGGAAQLGLVAARRSADVPAVMGWQGAINHNEWIAPLAAVLRSWEDRFGARLVRVGFNTLDLSVAAPPATVEHAVHVAAEHWAFCPDNIGQGPGDLYGYAEQIAGRNTWSFWWD